MASNYRYARKPVGTMAPISAAPTVVRDIAETLRDLRAKNRTQVSPMVTFAPDPTLDNTAIIWAEATSAEIDLLAEALRAWPGKIT